MRKLLMAAAVAAMSLPMAAGAATTINNFPGSMNGGGYAAGLSTGTEAKISFGWAGGDDGEGDGSPASGFVKFTVTNAFDLIFENYVPEGGTETTGFILFDTNGTYYATGSDCSSEEVLEAIRGQCGTMAGEASLAAPAAAFTPDKDNPIFRLAAGTYYIGFYEDDKPERGGADFRTIEVPLPAGGLLLLTALGGAAMIRRRRKA